MVDSNGDAAHVEINASNGDKYSGPVKAGKMHDRGKMIHADGNVYEGDFEGNQRCGMGN